MITQTLALLLDAYRELNAKRLFWITLILSGVFVVVFALFGVDDSGITLLEWRFNQDRPHTFYKAILLKILLVDIWLTWAATILALISTAGLFPDFIAGGSVDLYLARPISRLRMFFTKYATGMLFAAIQVSIVAVGVFLAVGFRLGNWMPGLLLAVPIVLCFYSYLFAICVLFGVLTRSTVASVLLVLLAWLTIWGVLKAESQLLFFQFAQETRSARFQQRFDDAGRELDRLKAEPSIMNAFGIRANALRADREKYQRLREEAGQASRSLAGIQRVLHATAVVLPKTGPTIDLLGRYLLRDDEFPPPPEADETPEDFGSFGRSEHSVLSDPSAQMIAAVKLNRALRARSLGWVIGTSLAFEAVVLTLAAVIFCRRDF